MNFSNDESHEVRQLKKQKAQADLFISQLQQDKDKQTQELVDLRSKAIELQSIANDHLAKHEQAEQRAKHFQDERDRKALENANLEQALRQSQEERQKLEKSRKFDDNIRDDALGRREKELMDEREHWERKCNKLEAQLKNVSSSSTGVTLLGTSESSGRLSVLEKENIALKKQLGSSSLQNVTPAASPISPASRVQHNVQRRSSGVNVSGSEEERLREANAHLIDQLASSEARTAKAERDSLKASNERLASERQIQNRIDALTSERDELKDEVKMRDEHVNELERRFTAVEDALYDIDSDEAFTNVQDIGTKVKVLIEHFKDAQEARQMLERSVEAGGVPRFAKSAKLCEVVTDALKSFGHAQSQIVFIRTELKAAQEHYQESQTQLERLSNTQDQLQKRERELLAAKAKLKKLSKTLRKAVSAGMGSQSFMADASLADGNDTALADTTFNIRGFDSDVVDEVENILTYVEDLDEKLEFHRVESEIQQKNLNAELNDMRGALGKAQAEIEDMESAHTFEKGKLTSELTQSNDLHKRELLKRESLLEKLRAEQEHLKQQLTQQQQDAEKERNQLLSEKADDKRCVEAVQQAQHHCYDQMQAYLLRLLDQGMENWRDDVAQMHTTASEQLSEAWTLVAEFKAQQATLDEKLQQSNEQARHTKDLLAQTVSENDQNAEELQQALACASDQVIEIEGLNKRIGELQLIETAHKIDTQKIQSMQNQLERIPILQRELEEAKAEVAEVCKDLFAAEEEVRALQEQNTSLSSIRKALDEKLQGLETRDDDLARIHDLEANATKQEEVIADLQNKQAHAGELSQLIDALQDRLERRNATITALKVELEQEQTNRRLAEDVVRRSTTTREDDVTVFDGEIDQSVALRPFVPLELQELRQGTDGTEKALQEAQERIKALSAERDGLIETEARVKQQHAAELEEKADEAQQWHRKAELADCRAKDQANVLEKQLLELQASLDTILEKEASATEYRDSLKQRCKDLEESLAAAKVKLDESEAELSQLRALQQAGDEQDAQSSELQDRLAEKQNTLCDLEEQLSSALGEMKAMRQEETSLKAQLADFERRLQEGETKIAAMTQKELQLCQDQDRLAADALKKGAELVEVTQARDEAMAQVTVMRMQLEELQGLKSMLEAQLSKAKEGEEEIKRLADDVSAANDMLASEVEQHAQSRIKLESLSAELEDARHNESTIKVELESLQASKASTQDSVSIYKVQALEEELTAAQATIQQLEQELSIKAQECEDADDKELELRKENKRLASRLAQLQQKLDRALAPLPLVVNPQAATTKASSSSRPASRNGQALAAPVKAAIATNLSRKRPKPDDDEIEIKQAGDQKASVGERPIARIDRALVYAPKPAILTTSDSASHFAPNNSSTSSSRDSTRAIESVGNTLTKSNGHTGHASGPPSTSVALKLQQQLADQQSRQMMDKPKGTASSDGVNLSHAPSFGRLVDRTNKPKLSALNAVSNGTVTGKTVNGNSDNGQDNQFMTKLSRFRPTAGGTTTTGATALHGRANAVKP